MGELKVSFRFEGLEAMLKAAERLGKAGRYAVNRAVDEVGNKVTTKMKRATADQAGVSYGRVSAVISKNRRWAPAAASSSSPRAT